MTQVNEKPDQVKGDFPAGEWPQGDEVRYRMSKKAAPGSVPGTTVARRSA
jgi:hypothetical protein